MIKEIDTLKPLGSATVLALGAAVALAACGGSSAARAARTTVAATSGVTGASGLRPGPSRLAALRECLAKNGVTIAGRPPSDTTRPSVPALPPAGVSHAAYEAALRRCGASALGGPSARAGAGTLLKSAAFRKRLEEFAGCMRSHGVNLSAPNTSGRGSIFSTRGVSTAGAAFQSAYASCRGDLGTAAADRHASER